MKLVNRCFLLFALWLGSCPAWSQSCASIPNDPTAFEALDVNGSPVAAFCVGQPVHFEPRPGRNIPFNFFAYGVLPGVGTTFTATGCTPPRPNSYPYTYTPTQIGDVTVSELANFGSIPTYYTRTYQVYGTPPPAFTVVPCPAGLVQVTVTDAIYNSYKVLTASGLVTINRIQPLSITPPAGATTVDVTGYYTAVACPGTNSQPIPALAAPQTPLFTRLTLQGPVSGGAATFDVAQLPAGYLYTLQIDDGSAPGVFRRVADVPAGRTSFSLAGAVAGCYRLIRTDVCASSTVPSTVICTLSLAGSSTNNRNQLRLTEAGAGSSSTYTVTRNSQPYSTLTRTADGFDDADVQCRTTYTYRVTATQPGGTSVSNEVTIPTQSALPPRQPLLVASFNLNNVVVLTPVLATPLTAGSSLRYRRASGNQPPADFGPVATTGRPQRDSTALDELRALSPCYTLRLTDVCGTSPESPAACPSLLAANPADPDGRTAALTWTIFTGPNPTLPVTYTLQRLAADGSVLSTVAVSGTNYTDLTPPTDRQTLRYRLQVSGAGLPPGTFSYSNLASLTRQLILAIPTAFTPNGDGLNDVLEVKGRYLRDYTFVVVDRNGQEVFRGTQRSQAWDGTIRGHAPVLGAYVWRFQQNNDDGKPFTATGAVTILK